MKPKFRSLLAASIVVTFSSQAFAAPVVKENNADALNLNSSWVGGTSQPGAGDIAVWDATVNANQVVPMGADLSWGGIDMTNSGGDVTIDVGNTLTLGASGITSAANKWIWINSGVVLGTNQSWTTPNNLFIGGVISGSATLQKAGPAILTLSNANSWTGGMTVTAGQLTTKNGAALGTNTLTLGDGTTYRYERTGGNATTFQGNAITVSPNSAINITTDNAGNGYSGVVSAGPNSTVTIGSATSTTQCSFSSGGNIQQLGGVTGTVKVFDGASIRFSSTSGVNNGGSLATWDTGISGVITARNTGTVNLGALIGTGSITGSSGATGTTTYSIGGKDIDATFGGVISDGNLTDRKAAVTKVGTGIQTFTGNNTYTGITNVNSGTLLINGSKTGTGTVTVASGAKLGGTGSISGGLVTVANGGILSPGDALVAGGIGNFSLSNLTLSSGSVLNIQFGAGNDSATVTSALTLTAGATVDVNGFGTNGTYTIINTAGATVTGVASTALSAVNVNGAKIYSFNDTGSAITMTISSTDPVNYWKNDTLGTASWNVVGNWTKNVVPNASGAIAKFGQGPANNGGFFTDTLISITLDGNRTVGSLAFQDNTGTAFTIDPGTTTPGSLLFDNGAVASILTGISGNHIINAPMVVDADGLSLDVADTWSMALNGVVSGASAAISKSGLGTLVLAGDNSYGGGTSIAGGVVNINSATSLGNVASAATFSGGTLQLANSLLGISRSYKVAGTSNANINTNGFDFGYDGVISPAGGGTGGLVKSGGGTMTLTAAQTYTGATNVTGGTLAVVGGSIASNAASSVTSANLTLSSGSVAFNAGFNGNSSNPSSAIFVNLAGGTFSASSVTLGRNTSNTNIVTNPIAGSAVNGFYVNGAVVSVSGNVNVGQGTNTNSTSSLRMDSGSMTVGGGTVIQVNSPDRWSVLDVNGGTFTSTDTVTGVQIGSGLTGNDVFLVRNGIATVERFLLIQPGASTLTSRINLLGGSLYIGEGGIVGNNNAGAGILDVQLGTATLGAKADWSTLLGATLNGTTVVKAADVADAAHSISIGGVVAGAGGLTKTGGGTLTLSGLNTYAGATQVNAGTLAITGNSSGSASAITVVSGATLGGNGNIGGSVTIQSGGHQAMEVADLPGNQVPRVITGALDLTGGPTTLYLTAAVAPAPGVYVLVSATGGITGTLPTVTGVTGTLAKVGNELRLTVGAVSDYTTWAAIYSPADLTNTAGDNDKDGLTNQQEFAFGLNPVNGSSVNPIVVQLSKSAGTFTYRRRATTGLTYKILTSTTLTGWTVDAAATAGQVAGAVDGNGNQTVVVTLSGAPLTATKLFVRVSAN